MEFKSLRDLVTDRMREKVLLGQYEPGEQLKEIPLAEEFAVSRGPIRDALLQLSREGLLEFYPNRGVRVGDVWAPELMGMMITMRFEIESHAVSQLIKNPSEEFSDRIQKVLRYMRIACEDKELSSILDLDLRFHRTILKCSGHARLEKVWLTILGGMRFSYQTFSVTEKMMGEHEEIADAIVAGDLTRSLTALEENLKGTDPYKHFEKAAD